MKTLLTALTAAALGFGTIVVAEAPAAAQTVHHRTTVERSYHHKRAHRVCTTKWRHHKRVRTCRTVWR